MLRIFIEEKTLFTIEGYCGLCTSPQTPFPDNWVIRRGFGLSSSGR